MHCAPSGSFLFPRDAGRHASCLLPFVGFTSYKGEGLNGSVFFGTYSYFCALKITGFSLRAFLFLSNRRSRPSRPFSQLTPVVLKATTYTSISRVRGKDLFL